MKLLKRLTLPLSFLLLSACGSDDSGTEIPILEGDPLTTVTYELTFTHNWTSSTFATQYPSNAHFSPFIGLTHNSEGGIFALNETASEGMISMAETGSKDKLRLEIGNIQNLGHSVYFIDESGVGQNENKVTMTFDASPDYSMLSVVSMVAPSPDWFIGINSLPLFVNGEWIESTTINTTVYDAGSDNGTTFTSANNATTPLDVIKILSSSRSDSDFEAGKHFSSGDYIGKIEIKLLKTP